VAPARTLTISGREVGWTAGATKGWINVSPGSGTAPGAVTVSLPGTGGYGVGTHEGQVEVTVGETGIEYGVPMRLIVAARLRTVYLLVVAR
jgi:hypothetical protein